MNDDLTQMLESCSLRNYKVSDLNESIFKNVFLAFI